ncbi:MAG TPA: oxygen-dependent coproporphyrinogen oxidase [Acidimicrobiia bacterium]|nr:oxygen-dependent coproporphyrinogen oxidase [Acidimicrobiia bacterium]
MTAPSRANIESFYRGFQDRFASRLEVLDGTGRFVVDRWTRPGGGGGETRILSGGRHIDKAAVNFSSVHGETPPQLSDRMAAMGDHFSATGVSIIVHPSNPYAPTFHGNVRYFESDDGTAWFGGGADLTPYYFFADDATHFHRVIADVCLRHPVADYPAWKHACDRYFHLAHRGEARGIGGVFFDHLTERLEDVWSFQQDLADRLVDAYLPILEARVDTPYGEREIEWHRIRRGRYVEFNLVWDRGTKFGLETGGRTESILASLPPHAIWVYDHHPSPGSPEAELLAVLTGEPRSWV